MKTSELDLFTRQYLVTALWSTNDESTPSGGVPLDDNYDIEDIFSSSIKASFDECQKFQTENAALLAEAYKRPGYNVGRAGHDFFLNRNGHGTGFWDRDELEEGDLGEKLSEASHKFKEAEFYIGDDKKIHC